jgi:DNA polymerase-3 subunit delta
VTAEQIDSVVADNARFDVFGMVDSIMRGDAALACRMLFKLRQEGINPVPILSVLSREIRDLVAMSSGAQPVGYVFPARKKKLDGAVRRYPAAAWQALLPRAAMLDGLSKGQQPRYRPPADVWDELVDLVTKMSGAPRAVPRAQ